MSSSEEDVHQCGRCKEQFHSLDKYFYHKKAGKCHKVKNADNELQPCSDDIKESESPERDFDEIRHRSVRAPAKKRRAAREIGKYGDGNISQSVAFDNGFTDRKVRVSKRSRTIAKNLKKAWAENYKDSVQDAALAESFQAIENQEVGTGSTVEVEQLNLTNTTVTAKYEDTHTTSVNEKVTAPSSDVTKDDNTDSYDQLSPPHTRYRGQKRVIVSPESDELDDDDDLDEEYSDEEDDDDGYIDDDSDFDEEPKVTNVHIKKKRKKGYKRKPKFDENGVKIKRRPRCDSYVCSGCDHVSDSREEFQRHMRRQHAYSRYRCSKCQLMAKHPLKIERHVKKDPCKGATILHIPHKYEYMLRPSMHVMNRLSETIGSNSRGKFKLVCLRVVLPYDENEVCLQYHTRMHCEGTHTENTVLLERSEHGLVLLSITCNECNQKCYSFKETIAHFFKHWQFYPAMCRYCAKVLTTRRGLIRHVYGFQHDHLTDKQLLDVKQETVEVLGVDEVQRVLQPKPLASHCYKCKTDFDDMSLLAVHLVEDHEILSVNRLYKCGSCSFESLSRNELENHIIGVHPAVVEPTLFQCPLCDRHFKLKYKAIKHREVLHTAIQQAPYDPVAAENADSPVLDLDEILVQREMSCFVCDEVFSSRRDWLKHVYNHQVWVADKQNGGPVPSNLFEDLISGGLPVLKINVKISESVEIDVNLQANSPDEVAKPKGDLLKLKSSQIRRKKRKNKKHKDGKKEENTGVSVLQSMADNIPKPGPNDTFADQYNYESKQIHSSVEYEGLDSLLTTPEQIATSLLASATFQDNSNAGNKGKQEDKEEESEIENSDEKTHLLCPYCLELKDSLQEMYTHKVEVHRLVAVFKCIDDTCHQVFDSLHEFQNHSEIHPQKAFVCNLCNWHMSKYYQLLAHKTASHRTIHKLDSGFCCQVCHMTFGSKAMLVSHTESKADHHMCKECNRVYKRRHELDDHMLIHTQTQDILCDQCGATFINRLALNRHRRSHGKKVHKCPEAGCDKTFNKQEHLRRHLNSIHSDEKPFECTYPDCAKRFKRKDKMFDHLKKHSGDKPFSCKVCGRRYRYKEGLNYHEKKSHNEDEGQSIYKCQQCCVTFTRPNMLKQHLLQQHEVKKKHPYQCSKCILSFSRPERLNRHLEKVHKDTIEWVITCPICRRGFPGERSFETHMALRHKNKKQHGKIFRSHDMIQQAMNETIHMNNSVYQQSPEKQLIVHAGSIHAADTTKMIQAHPLYEISPQKIIKTGQPFTTEMSNVANKLYTTVDENNMAVKSDARYDTSSNVSHQPGPVGGGYSTYTQQVEPEHNSHFTQQVEVDGPTTTVEWFGQPITSLQPINITYDVKQPAGQSTITTHEQQHPSVVHHYVEEHNDGQQQPEENKEHHQQQAQLQVLQPVTFTYDASKQPINITDMAKQPVNFTLESAKSSVANTVNVQPSILQAALQNLNLMFDAKTGCFSPLNTRTATVHHHGNADTTGSGMVLDASGLNLAGATINLPIGSLALNQTGESQVNDTAVNYAHVEVPVNQTTQRSEIIDAQTLPLLASAQQISEPEQQVQITQVQPPKKKRAARKPRNTKAASTKQSSSTPEASTSQSASGPAANRTSITLPAEMTHAKLLMQLQYIVEKERNKIAAKQEMGEQDDDTPVDLSTFMKQVVVPNFTADDDVNIAVTISTAPSHEHAASISTTVTSHEGNHPHHNQQHCDDNTLTSLVDETAQLSHNLLTHHPPPHQTADPSSSGQEQQQQLLQQQLTMPLGVQGWPSLIIDGGGGSGAVNQMTGTANVPTPKFTTSLPKEVTDLLIKQFLMQINAKNQQLKVEKELEINTNVNEVGASSSHENVQRDDNVDPGTPTATNMMTKDYTSGSLLQSALTGQLLEADLINPINTLQPVLTNPLGVQQQNSLLDMTEGTTNNTDLASSSVDVQQQQQQDTLVQHQQQQHDESAGVVSQFGAANDPPQIIQPIQWDTQQATSIMIPINESLASLLGKSHQGPELILQQPLAALLAASKQHGVQTSAGVDLLTQQQVYNPNQASYMLTSQPQQLLDSTQPTYVLATTTQIENITNQPSIFLSGGSMSFSTPVTQATFIGK